jgi:hypothetical protein
MDELPRSYKCEVFQIGLDDDITDVRNNGKGPSRISYSGQMYFHSNISYSRYKITKSSALYSSRSWFGDSA